jgi:hypothetical protein
MNEKTETKATLSADRGSVTVVHTDAEAFTVRLTAGDGKGGARLTPGQLRQLAAYLNGKADRLERAEIDAKELNRAKERAAKERVQRAMHGDPFARFPRFEHFSR